MFYGRDTELLKLNQMYDSNKFEFAVIYGRRRVGKTTLIREFIKDKKSLFFAASESTASDNLLSLSRCIGGSNDAPVFRDYETALAAIFKSAENERLIFIIDEFPYLAESYRGFSSLLQILIDHNKDNIKLMLILCGSSMSFMENQVLGYQSPLYGRRTAQFKILPFTFFNSLPFFDGYNNEDKTILYGVTGGVPEYLNKINSSKTVRENIFDMFLTTSGHFFEEPSNLIKQELREPSTYNVIIEAIASGSSRLNEIATKCKIESNKCAKYLSSLMTLGLVVREYPYGETTSKRSIYRLEDNMFRFWYRFVFPNQSAIISGLGVSVYDNVINEQLNAYMGLIFEDICKQWFFVQARKEPHEHSPPFFIGSIGRWWGTNSATRKQEEIDIMAVRGDNALFAECKWTNADVDIDIFHDLKRKSAMFQYKSSFLYIFTKNSVSSKVYDEYVNGRVKIYPLDELIKLSNY
ncbi:MAG: ATP-binding protein [Defluviitaleaceae bacterium]|nr:ATP-binding protein [Defluviitaleaceae bacterium]